MSVMRDAGRDALRFEDVTKRLRRPIKGYLRKFVGDLHLAEDLLQETLLKIARGLPTFRGESSLKTWAFRIATRTAIDSLRKTRVDAKTVGIDEDDPPPGDFDLVGDRIVIREMNSCIREEIDSLPEDYRAAILLHDLEGLTAAETAEATGCSLATAKIRIHRARVRLKKILERDCQFYFDREQTLRCDRKPAEEDE
jgi:RNA polymerase sigma-70 factor (ECF subfamily)